MSVVEGGDLTEGTALLQAGQYAEAVDFFSRRVQTQPLNGQAFGYLGIALIRLGKMTEGLTALGQASQLQPQDAPAQYNVAVGLMQAGRSQEALPFLNYTLTLDPQHAQARQAIDSISRQLAEKSQPAAYDGSQAPPLTGPVIAADSYGRNYAQSGRSQVVHVPPPLGMRVVRGLGWGALYGQFWTGWKLFWDLVWNFKAFSPFSFLAWALGLSVVFALGGMLAGVVIAFLKPSMKSGIAVGIVMGLIFFGLENAVYMAAGTNSFYNIFFWYFTGRYVGAKVTLGVHRPIEQ